AQEAAFAQRSIAARRAELQRHVLTAREQEARLAAEREHLQTELERLSDTTARNGLQDALAERQRREQVLVAQRRHYDELSARLRAADEQRLRIERELDPLRARMTEFQLKEQAAQLALDQYGQWLAEAGVDPGEVGRSVDIDGVRLQSLPGEIDRLQRDIAALGAVNLAALQELSAARERQQFLAGQSRDLQQAIQTLEDAIRKIDAETRELLARTFETVNGHFGRMFPELFGGGQARLILTGEEILDAGVQVIAQPPGKKNQTIHLLSGGEKALTAIALVFAIFQLNPAPFCLLDEVDAPLDDVNTERYARLVTRMSSETQFLFISHNRIAMEMAQQLVGVTMQEQGVSRIVAVDLAGALSLVDNAAP
ncbi:MAG: chromosome segregation protein SMC, partial [Tepidimonas sp.]